MKKRTSSGSWLSPGDGTDGIWNTESGFKVCMCHLLLYVNTLSRWMCSLSVKMGIIITKGFPGWAYRIPWENVDEHVSGASAREHPHKENRDGRNSVSGKSSLPDETNAYGPGYQASMGSVWKHAVHIQVPVRLGVCVLCTHQGEQTAYITAVGGCGSSGGTCQSVWSLA